MSPTTLGFAVASSPQVLHVFAYRTSDTEAERCADHEKVGLGRISRFFFLSFFVLVSLLCSLMLLKTQLILPHSLPVTAPILHMSILLPFHSFHTTQIASTPIHATHFRFNFPFLCITNKTHKSTLPMHQDFQKSNLYVGEGERSRTQYCLHVSKQQSDHKCQNRKATAGPGQTKLKKPQPKARQGHQSVLYLLAYNGHLHRPEKSTILTKHCFQRENRKHPRILVQEQHININTGI